LAEDKQSNTVLLVNALRKKYSTGKKDKVLSVLDGISFSMREGEFVTLIGPSGSGKSTLLNIIAGLETYDSGDVVVSGRRERGDIVMIFQEDALFPWLTVKGNVEFGLKQKKGISKEERTRIVSEYIDLVDLTPFANSYVHQLSGGMKQRVAIARALALDPRILLMDEPFGALDARTRQGLQKELQRIHEITGKTILFVTHDVREAVSLGDRVILFSRRPAKIRREYFVDLSRPRNSEDPSLSGTINSILEELNEDTEEDNAVNEANIEELVQ